MAWHYGLGLAREARIADGTIYPSLSRLEKAEWVESKWEAGPGGKPPRRLYRLTGLGQRVASAAGADAGRKRVSIARRGLWAPFPRRRIAQS